MPAKQSDYVFHPPSGSSLPGREEDANPYIFYPPDEIRRLMQGDVEPGERKKMDSALKQWERQYVDQIGFPYKKVMRALRVAPRNLRKYLVRLRTYPYYQDAEVPEGYEGIIEEGMKNLHDEENQPKVNLKRPGERPVRDVGDNEGDFLSPDEPVVDPRQTPILPRGVGDSDPDGLYYSDPPTGGETGGI